MRSLPTLDGAVAEQLDTLNTRVHALDYKLDMLISKARRAARRPPPAINSYLSTRITACVILIELRAPISYQDYHMC